MQKKERWKERKEKGEQRIFFFFFPYKFLSCTKNGRRDRDRTRDTRFWRPMLYQLSYPPTGNIKNTERNEFSQEKSSKRIYFFLKTSIADCWICFQSYGKRKFSCARTSPAKSPQDESWKAKNAFPDS